MKRELEAASLVDLVEISPGKVKDSSASSTGQESLGAYDANRACVVKTVKGRIVEAKMTAGKDGFMYASYGSGQPSRLRSRYALEAVLGSQREKAIRGRHSPEEIGHEEAAAASKSQGKAKAKAKSMALVLAPSF